MKFNGKAFFNSSLLIKVLFGVGYVLSAFLLAKLGLWGLKEPNRLPTTIAVCLLLILFTPSKLTFWLIVFPLSLCVGLYAPISYIYGFPDYQALITLLATDTTEATEFLGLISTKLYLKALSIPMLALAAHFFAQYSGLKLWRNKTFVLIAAVLLIVAQPPTAFYTHTEKAIKDYLVTTNYSPASSWSPSKTSSLQKDYVLIIGESARRDYFHVYGYPVDNTPFLDEVNDVIVDGLIASDTYTIGSLSKMLTAGENKKPRYDRTIVGLANSAGIETVWITNQTGKIKYEAPVIAISSKADKAVYLRHSASDFELIDALNNVLQEKTNANRFIVVHTHGSHFNACGKITKMKTKYEVTDSYYDYVACYVTSIKRTDYFIEQVYNTLEQHRKSTMRPFSIIYFSDHGEQHYEEDGRLILYHVRKGASVYDIPLIKIDSQSSERKYLKSRKSGFRFTEGLADWMEISNPEIRKYDLFDGISDTNDYGMSKIIKEISLDPAIDITPMLKTTNQ